MKTTPLFGYARGFLIATAVLVSGCSTEPVYRTSYQLTEPASTAGRQCTTQCETNRLLCTQNASAEQRQCQENAQQEIQQCKRRARSDYDNCMRQASHLGSYRASTEGSCRSILQSSTNNCEYSGGRCDLDTRHCDRSYRGCFSNCGGTVTKQVRCVANCDKK